jgi:hypothetical protein
VKEGPIEPREGKWATAKNPPLWVSSLDIHPRISIHHFSFHSILSSSFSMQLFQAVEMLRLQSLELFHTLASLERQCDTPKPACLVHQPIPESPFSS